VIGGNLREQPLAITERNASDHILTRLPARLPPLDGMRGIGMVGVFLGHLAQYSGLSASTFDNATLKILLQAGYAVVMFFVLSGFLITGILLDAKGRPNYFRRFFSRRSKRIFPLYFTFVFVAMVVIPAVYPVSQNYRDQASEQAWYWTYTVNFVIADRGWDDFQFFGHLWTLAVEEQFYVFWPFVVLALSVDRLRHLCVGLLFVGLGTRLATMYAGNEVATDVLTFSNLDSLAMGALIAIHARSGKPFPVRAATRMMAAAPLLLVSLFVWPLLIPSISNITWSLAPTVTMLGAASLIVVALFASESSRLYRITTWRPAVVVGDISYGIYVFHQPIIFLVVRSWGIDAQDAPSIGSWHLPGMLVVGVVSFGVTIGLALLSSRFVEKPALRIRLTRAD
jgi:peptidoglycan/LPS O-acetylase OafA/YrhL